MREAARSYSPAGIQRLAQLAGLTEHPPAEHEAVQVACIAQLLDRAWGKPTQVVAGDDRQPLLIDFRWADARPEPVVTADAAAPLTIDADAEAGDMVVTWAGEGGK